MYDSLLQVSRKCYEIQDGAGFIHLFKDKLVDLSLLKLIQRNMNLNTNIRHY